jgi:hypothetical protein
MPQSETLPAEGPGPTTPTPEQGEAPEQRRTLADLLRDDDDKPEPETAGQGEPEQGQKGEAGESRKQAKPKGLQDLAERLNLKPADLYAIEIPMSSGEPMTLGKLKDLAAESGDLSEREIRFEEDRTRRENELAAAKAELQDLVAALPREALKPEILDKLKRRRDEYTRREKAQTLDAIPEWRDEATRTEEIGGMLEHLKGYGFPESYLGSIIDHRTLRYIRDNWRREQRIRRALDQVEKGKPPKSARSAPAGSAPAKPGNSPKRSSTDPRSQLLALLN